MLGIQYRVFDMPVGDAPRRAQLAMHPDFGATLGPHDMTPQRFAAMAVIAGNDAVAQSALRQGLGIARSGVARVVDTLMTRGRLARESHRIDALARALHPAPAGHVHLAVVR